MLDSIHDFAVAVSSNTEGLADGVFGFLKAIFNLVGDLVLGSSAPAEPAEPTTIPLVPLEPATPIEADPAE